MPYNHHNAWCLAQEFVEYSTVVGYKPNFTRHQKTIEEDNHVYVTMQCEISL